MWRAAATILWSAAIKEARSSPTGHRVRRGHDDRGAVRLTPRCRAGDRLQDGRRQVLPHLLHAAPGPLHARSRAQLRGEPEGQGLLDRVHLRDRQGNLLQAAVRTRADTYLGAGRRRSARVPEARSTTTCRTGSGKAAAICSPARPARGRGLCRRFISARARPRQRRRRPGGRDQGDGDRQDRVLNASEMEKAIGDTGKVAHLRHPVRLRQGRVETGVEADARRDRQTDDGKPELKLKIVGHTDNRARPNTISICRSGAPRTSWRRLIEELRRRAPTGCHRKAPASPSRSPPTIPRKAGQRTVASNSSRNNSLALWV